MQSGGRSASAHWSEESPINFLWLCRPHWRRDFGGYWVGPPGWEISGGTPSRHPWRRKATGHKSRPNLIFIGGCVLPKYMLRPQYQLSLVVDRERPPKNCEEINGAMLLFRRYAMLFYFICLCVFPCVRFRKNFSRWAKTHHKVSRIPLFWRLCVCKLVWLLLHQAHVPGCSGKWGQIKNK